MTYSNSGSVTSLEENHSEKSCELNIFGTLLMLLRNLLVPEPPLRAPAQPPTMSQQENFKLSQKLREERTPMFIFSFCQDKRIDTNYT